MEVILTPLLDMLPHLIELTLSSLTRLLNCLLSEASGLRRSRRQALDPLSVVKPAKRETMLLARWLGEVGALGEVRIYLIMGCPTR
jgi:hypothetical protein